MARCVVASAALPLAAGACGAVWAGTAVAAGRDRLPVGSRVKATAITAISTISRPSRTKRPPPLRLPFFVGEGLVVSKSETLLGSIDTGSVSPQQFRSGQRHLKRTCGG